MEGLALADDLILSGVKLLPSHLDKTPGYQVLQSCTSIGPSKMNGNKTPFFFFNKEMLWKALNL